MKNLRLALIAGLIAITSAAGAETTLTLASGAPAPAPINRALEQWAASVGEATDGKLTVNVVAGGTLGTHGQLYDRVTSGVVDIAWDFQGYYPNRFPRSSVAELPFMFETAVKGSLALQSLYDNGMISGEYEDVVLLGMFAFPNNSVVLTKPRPESGMLDGLRLSAQNPTMYAAAEALGGIPVSMGIPDWYPALSRGTIDGAIVAFTAVPAFRFQEVASHYYKASLGGNTAFVFMSRSTFGGLSKDVQADLISASGASLAEHMGRFLDDQAKKGEALAASSAEEIAELTADEAAAWEEALTPLRDAWLDRTKDGQALIDGFQAAVASISAD